MNGVDAIVFTAGIGENAIPVREKVVSYLGYLGVTLDKDANGHRGEEIVISTPDSKVKGAVIPTDEELISRFSTDTDGIKPFGHSRKSGRILLRTSSIHSGADR